MRLEPRRRYLAGSVAITVLLLVAATGCGKTTGGASTVDAAGTTTRGSAAPRSTTTVVARTTSTQARATTTTTSAATTTTTGARTTTTTASGSGTLAAAAVKANAICARYNAQNKAVPVPADIPSAPPYTQHQMDELATVVDATAVIEANETTELAAITVPAANAAAYKAVLDVQKVQAAAARTYAAQFRAGNSAAALAGIDAFNAQGKKNDAAFDALGMKQCGSASNG